MSYKKLIITSAVILFVGFVLVCIIPIARKIDKTLDCVEYHMGQSDDMKKTTMTIKGTYYDFLFTDDSFLGEIKVGSWDLTNDENYKLTSFNLKRGWDTLHYKYDGEYRAMGTITADTKFNQVLICIYEDDEHGNSWSSSDGRVISSPASSLKEAKENASYITKKFKHMDMIDWTK